MTARGRVACTLPSLPLARRQAKLHGLAVLVGQAPPEKSDPREPLFGASGKAVAERCGLPFPGPYAGTFDRVNLLQTWPGKNDRGGDLFDVRTAAREAHALAPELFGRFVVLLGKRVARAFGLTAGFYSTNVVSRTYLGWEQATVPGAEHAYWRAARKLRETRGEAHGQRFFVAAVVPHPSRVSRWWNDPAAVDLDREFWRELLHELRAEATSAAPRD